jgi:hypothetical protein
MPRDARRWKDAMRRVRRSNRSRYRSSVVIAVPVCWEKRRDDINDVGDECAATVVDGPETWNTSDEEAVMVGD